MADVGITRATTWNVYKTIGISRSTTWNVRTVAGISRTATWDVTRCSFVVVPSRQSACEPCNFLDTNVFKRVDVDYLTAGGARISWELDLHFIDPLPHTFQLQFSHGGVGTGDDWVNVGAPVVNGAFTFDPLKRMFSKTSTISYRLVLTTPIGAYASAPADASGKLDKRDWLLSREIIRKELLRHSKFNSVSGFLLKARRYGIPCTCLDPLTGEIIDTTCPDCGGTGFQGTGYYAPVPSQFVELGLEDSREQRELQMRGTIKDVSVKGRFLGCIPIVEGDAWVAGGSDVRYYVHTAKELAHWKSVPLIFEAELRPAAFSDVIYSLVLPS